MKAHLKTGGSFLVVVLFIVVAIAGRIHFEKQAKNKMGGSLRETQVTINGMALATKVADTDDLRIKGLSGTDSLPDDHALLFVFDRPDLYGFWMNDMKYPIDIIWISKDKKIISIKKHATPESYPEIFKPVSPALYVLEVSDGFVGSRGVSVGDTVLFDL